MISSEAAAYIFHTTPLIEAIKGRDLVNIKKICSRLVKNKDTTHQLNLASNVDGRGRCALYWVIEIEETGTLLIETIASFNINFNIYYGDGKTPLMHAIEKCRIDIVKFLIKQGAVLHLQDLNGNSALVYALHFGCDEIIQLLLNEILWRAYVNFNDYNHVDFRRNVFQIAGVKESYKVENASRFFGFIVTAIKNFIEGSFIKEYVKVVNILNDLESTYNNINTVYAIYSNAFPRNFPKILMLPILEYALNSLFPVYQQKIFKLHKTYILGTEDGNKKCNNIEKGVSRTLLMDFSRQQCTPQHQSDKMEIAREQHALNGGANLVR